METQRWQQLKILLDEALSRPPDLRPAYLEGSCDDEELRREALSLLAFYDEDPDFLEEPLRVDALRLIADDAEVDQVGARVGPYRLVREIGQGGMGTVYLAERADGAYEQQVAVKFVRQGGPREELLRRLRHERQILAYLKHPNIARLLDGGVTEEGQPFLVMEYVEGLPIDRYCEEQALSTAERLDLFQTVCTAVQYAHRNLIVHRDLKPSNIMVTEDGRVKLLDFGIAKLLDEETVLQAPLTRTGLRVMTPEYASPEQVRGEPVTTVSDVYALGIILYQLLTGRRPYEVRNLSASQIEQVVCETEPPRPSTAVLQLLGEAAGEVATSLPRIAPERLRRQLLGDLDNIVLKALRKEPGRRYGSAAELSEDLRRYQARLPVGARPDTVQYRVSKFIRRHLVGVGATVLVLLALLGGIITTTYQARVAAAERDRAEQRFNDVRALANKLLFDLHDAIRDLPGATPARQMLVGEALTYLNTLARETSDDPTLQLELAAAYERVGEIQGDPHFPNLGDLSGATESYRKAAALHAALWRQDPLSERARLALADSYGRLAVVLSWGGDNDRAITLSEQALELLAPLVEEASNNVAAQKDEGRIRSELGWWLIWAGRIPEAMAHLALAETRLEALAQREPEDLDLHIDLWRVYAYQDDGLQYDGDFETALARLEDKVYPHLQALARRFPKNARVQSCLRSCFNKMGNANEQLGRSANALSVYRSSLDIAQALVAADSTDKLGYRGVAASSEAIGKVLLGMDRPDAAFEAFQEALAIRRLLYEQDPDNGEAGHTLGSSYRSLCEMYLETNRLPEALDQCVQGVAVLEAAVAADPQNAVGRESLATTYVFTARVHRALARTAESEEASRRHIAEALAWYDQSQAVFEALRAVGISWNWTVHPDTVRAEREALAR